jgi:NAD(P)-dependent dehydrogenase (short-subunit alcohol dehydrogenase family)
VGILDGKVAIVTGAGRGLGRAHALLLASQGAAVVVNDLGAAGDGSGGADATPAQEVVATIEAAGGRAAVNGDDCSDWQGAERLVQQAVDQFGRLDALVCNAGILRDGMSFNLTEEQWNAVITVHLNGHFAPSHHAARYWRAESKAGRDVAGRLVFTSSEAALGVSVGQINYATAKAGILGMMAVFALELARVGVTANAVSPRARTRMTESAFDASLLGPDERGFDVMDPANVSPVVGWLVSDAAAAVTGQHLIAFGSEVHLLEGWTIHRSLTKDGAPFTVEELAERQAELFGDRPTGSPAPPVPVLGQ